MTSPAHEWMLELVTAAEELGYFIRSVGPDEIALVSPKAAGYVDVTIKGRLVSGALLRQLLVPVEKEAK